MALLNLISDKLDCTVFKMSAESPGVSDKSINLLTPLVLISTGQERQHSYCGTYTDKLKYIKDGLVYWL